MDAKQPQSNNKEGGIVETASLSENKELGIKRLRTFADDLANARERAGVSPEKPAEKSGGFFGSKKKEKMHVPLAGAEKIASKVVTPPHATVTLEQPDRQIIEQELARSGIITEPNNNIAELEVEEKHTSSVPNIRT